MKKLDIWSDKLVVCVIEPPAAEISSGTVVGKSSALTRMVSVEETWPFAGGVTGLILNEVVSPGPNIGSRMVNWTGAWNPWTDWIVICTDPEPPLGIVMEIWESDIEKSGTGGRIVSCNVPVSVTVLDFSAALPVTEIV